jgi:sporulation protein YlmC with PRC-barrel domain
MNHERLQSDRRVQERRASHRRGVDGEVLWRSSSEILGYSVQAADGALGRVEDFCFEEESSVITAIVVRGRGRLARQQRLLVPLEAIERVDWPARKVYLRPARAEIRQWSRAACPPPQHAAPA